MVLSGKAESGVDWWGLGCVWVPHPLHGVLGALLIKSNGALALLANCVCMCVHVYVCVLHSSIVQPDSKTKLLHADSQVDVQTFRQDTVDPDYTD